MLWYRTQSFKNGMLKFKLQLKYPVKHPESCIVYRNMCVKKTPSIIQNSSHIATYINSSLKCYASFNSMLINANIFSS